MEFPKEFEARMRALLGDDYSAFAAAFEGDAPTRGLRLNPLKLAPDRALPVFAAWLHVAQHAQSRG